MYAYIYLINVLLFSRRYCNAIVSRITASNYKNITNIIMKLQLKRFELGSHITGPLIQPRIWECTLPT